jgi:hypothetical protein
MAGSELVRHVNLKNSPEDYCGRVWEVAQLARRLSDRKASDTDKKFLRGYGWAQPCNTTNIVNTYLASIRKHMSEMGPTSVKKLLGFETTTLIKEIADTSEAKELITDDIERFQQHEMAKAKLEMVQSVTDK